MRDLIDLIEGLFEYQEIDGGTFTHNGNDYDLNAALAVTADRPVYDLPVADMEWVAKYDEADVDRVASADLNAPLLVTVWEGKLAVLDGLHRLAKAVEGRVEQLPAQIVAPCRLCEFRVGEADREPGCDDERFVLYREHSSEDGTTMWFFLPKIDTDLTDQLVLTDHR